MNLENKLKGMFQAVSQGRKCSRCANMASESHHIIEKNKSEILRYDPVNAYPVCTRCHTMVHTMKIDVLKELPEKRRSYLLVRKNKLFQNYLLEQGLTRDEFYKGMQDKLKRCINE